MSSKTFDRLVASILALALVLGLVQSTRISRPSAAAARRSGPALPADRVEAYRNALLASARDEAYLIPPREDVVYEAQAKLLGAGATKAEIEAAVEAYYAKFQQENNKNSRPNPLARLGRMKQLEIADRLQAQGVDASTVLTGTPQVLTVMLNFSGSQTFDTTDAVQFNQVCLTDTTTLPPTYTLTITGPQFNEEPEPTDNWSFWLDPATSYTGGFTKAFFEKLMYSTEGYTQTVRPDVPNPWTGGNGFNFSGVSFRNWYAENSRNVYIPTGAVEEVTIPKPVSYFGASACVGDDPTDDSASGIPRYSVAISATQQINAENPGFDWTQWDQEDTFDYDNDGNFHEPDGYVDHFFMIEAGTAQGGRLGEFLVWPHSSDVRAGDVTLGPDGNKVGGIKVSDDGPLGSTWVLNYTISDETGGLGVMVHEYGHDIGLPDNYSYTSGDANPGLWDEMGSGGYGGGLSSMNPVHHTIWDKAEPYLGWNDPVDIDLSTTTAVGEENAVEYKIGQQSKPPDGTIDGLRITLPGYDLTSSVTPIGENMWWSDRADDRNESIATTFNAQAGETITVSAALAYDIEQDFDYHYWEISSTVTGGWEPLSVYSDTLDLTTDDDPNGGNPTGNGITGTSPNFPDWITATATISPEMHGGGPVQFRFRYFTDPGVQNEGVFLDNIRITGSASGEILFDDAEGGDNWTHMSEGVNDTAPWRIFNGVTPVNQSYLVEWRNSGEGTGFNGVSDQQAFATAGFDMGLNRMYWIDELDELGNIAHVDRFHLHTPGMLVYYTTSRYEDNNIDTHILDDPSWGAKGRVLLADANPDPYYVEDADSNGDGNGPDLRAISDRRSAFDGAFTITDRPPFTLSSNLNQLPTDTVTTIPGQFADPNFRDRIGSAPGIVGPPGDAFFVDFDAGVVLPSRDNVPYDPAWPDLGLTGNPGLNAFGINLKVVDQADDGTWGKVKFWLDDDTVFVDKHASDNDWSEGAPISYTIDLKDASGDRYEDGMPYTFNAVMIERLPEGASIVPGSVSLEGNGTVFTGTSQLQAAAAGLGINVPDLSQVAAEDGSLLIWVGEIGGRRIDEPDARISYSATFSTACASPSTTLYVEQKMIEDTFRNGGAPFLWPKMSQYTAENPRACGQLFLPVVPALSGTAGGG